MRSRLSRLLLLGVLAATLVASQLGAGAPVGADMGRIIDFEELMDHCATAQLLGPDAHSTDALVGDPDVVGLDVLVMVDFAEGAEIEQIPDEETRAAYRQALFDEVREKLVVGVESYEPLALDLRYDRFELLQPLVDGAPRTRTTNAQEIIDLAKEQLGGGRPADIDVVYVATDLDIQLPEVGNAVAGLADCIGGIAHDDRAFAVGEVGVLIEDEGGIQLGPVAVYKDFSAKVAAHEIGHLLGGHHHYQECATPLPTAVERGELGPCTLMTNAVDFQTIPFSTLNGIVVRGHAEEYGGRGDRHGAEHSR